MLSIYSLTANAASSSQNINWQSYSQSAFDQAKKEHHLVLVFAHTDWCPWCNQMKNKTFTDPAVSKLVRSNFIPVSLNTDNEKKIANQYKSVELPTIIILDADKNVIQTFDGYSTPEDFTKGLNGFN